MLPNFFVVGAQKSGTTSLHNYLKDHPEIYLPANKETKFFVDDERYAKGIEYYESEHFSLWNREKSVGEVDPDYMYFNYCLERMSLYLNLREIKFIFILRNPVDRAFSHYLMTYRRGLETYNFEEALSCEKERINKNYRSNMHYSYFHRGLYHRQIKRFFKYTDKSYLLFLLTEELKNQPLECLEKCFKFLNVSLGYIPENIEQKYHPATVPRSVFLARLAAKDSIDRRFLRRIVPSRNLRAKIKEKFQSLIQIQNVDIVLSNKMRERLSNLYREENQRLSELIERDLDHWDYKI